MIDGSTRLLVIVGDPIDQVKSPMTFTTKLRERRRNHVMIPWHVRPDAFVPVMTGLMLTSNLDGIVVTYPYKERALALVGKVGPRAAQVGAANALRREPDGRWSADMFDGVGLLSAIASLGQDVRGRGVKLLGAGGAGSAIAFAVAEAGAAALSIYDIDAARAARLARNVAAAAPGCTVEAGDDRLGEATILINATPVGLRESDPMPARLEDLTDATTVVDIITRQGGTRLLAHAKARGCLHTGGTAMAEGQVEALLDFFRVSGGPADDRPATPAPGDVG